MSNYSSQYHKQGSAGHQNQSHYHQQQDPYRAMSSQSANRGSLPNAMNHGQTEIRYGSTALASASAEARFGGLYSSGNSSQPNKSAPQQASAPKIPTITAPGTRNTSSAPSVQQTPPRGNASSSSLPPRGAAGGPANLSFKPSVASSIPVSGPANSQPSTPTSHPVTYSRATISELVQVPPELSAFAAEPQFQQILLKVKEQTLINFISLNRLSENAVESVAIDAPNKDAAILARNLIETHFKLQMKLKMAESRLQKVQTDLFSAQGEIASGMMVEFTIPSDLIGLVIGKKGSRIKQIEQETGVSAIHVNGESGRITVMGPDSASVQRARENLELHEESFDLQPQHCEWLSNRLNASTLADIKQVSSLMVARVNRDKCTLDVVGILASVRNAKIMLSTQLEYIDKQIEVENSEKSTREQLQAVRKQYNMYTPNVYNNRDKGGSDHPNNKYTAPYSNFTSAGAGVHEGRRYEHDNRGGDGNNNNRDGKNNNNNNTNNQNNNNRRNNNNAKDNIKDKDAPAAVNASRTSSHDPLLNLSPPPASASTGGSKNAGNNQSQPTRVSNVDIDSLIGMGLNTKPPSAARIGIHEEFLAAQVKSGRIVMTVPSTAPETNNNNQGNQQNSNNKNNRRNNNNNQNKDTSGGGESGTVDQQNDNSNNKKNNRKNQNQNNQKNNDGNNAKASADDSGAASTANSNNNNRNKNNKNKNQNKDNSDGSGAAAVAALASGNAAGSTLVVTAPDAGDNATGGNGNNQSSNNKRNNQNNKRQNKNADKDSNVTGLGSPGKADTAASGVEGADDTTGNNRNNRRNNNNRNNNNSTGTSAITVVSTTGGPPTSYSTTEEKQRQLLSAVSIVSVVSSDSTLAGALASQLNINSSKAAVTVPVSGGRSNGPAASAKNNNNSSKDAKSSSETSAAESSSTSATDGAGAAVVAVAAPAVPKRAKRTTGTAAVTVNDLNTASGASPAGAAAATTTTAAPAPPVSSPSVPPPPGMGSPRVSAPPPGL